MEAMCTAVPGTGEDIHAAEAGISTAPCLEECVRTQRKGLSFCKVFYYPLLIKLTSMPDG
jgi:hypothetical protein